MSSSVILHILTMARFNLFGIRQRRVPFRWFGMGNVRSPNQKDIAMVEYLPLFTFFLKHNLRSKLYSWPVGVLWCYIPTSERTFNENESKKTYNCYRYFNPAQSRMYRTCALSDHLPAPYQNITGTKPTYVWLQPLITGSWVGVR